MANVRGAAVQPGQAESLRQQRDRIRVLEANPAGAIFPGDWVDVTVFENGWTASTNRVPTSLVGSVGVTDPPVGYSVTNGWVSLRGRLTPTSASAWQDGTVAFTLPAELVPEYDLHFVGDVGCGWEGAGFGAGVVDRFFYPSGGVGHVRVTGGSGGGEVIAYLAQPGGASMYGDAHSLLDDFSGYADNTRLDSTRWIQSLGGYICSYHSGGAGWTICPAPTPGTCINAGSGAGSTNGGPGNMYLGCGPLADSQVAVTIATSDPMTVALGLRCQWQSNCFAFFPAGLWVLLSSSATARMTVFTNQSDDFESESVTSAGDGPGFGEGDVVSARVNYDIVSVMVNDEVVFNAPLHYGAALMPSGLLGVGYSQAAASTGALVSDFSGGIADNLGVSLNQVQFRLPS